jgi:hypothetical protein
VGDRFPGVRIGFLEAGGGWLPGWLDRNAAGGINAPPVSVTASRTARSCPQSDLEMA